MDIKTHIKNDFPRINWIIPFSQKYLSYGKGECMKRIFTLIKKVNVIHCKEVESSILKLIETIKLEVLSEFKFFYWIDTENTIAVNGNIISNFTLDYKQVIEDSFLNIASKAIRTGGRYGERATIIKKAIFLLYKRCISAINNSDIEMSQKKIMLYNMKDLLIKPAEHFSQGLQRILFFNQYLWQTRHRLNGIGRIDKILGSLYEKDLNAGLLTRESAKEGIKEFLKILHQWYEYKSAALVGDVGQIMILGGLENSENYFCNELTYIFLEVQAECKLPDPKILLRVSERMPKKLLDSAVNCLGANTGSPLFSNDDCIIPKLIKFGIDKNDAYNYCVSACWEPFIVGKSLDQNNIKTFDFFKPLCEILQRENLNEIVNFEQLLKIYIEQLKVEANIFVKNLDQFVWARDSFVSMFTQSCNKQGKDISEGGAIYNNYGVTTVGMGSVCDSLLHLKEIVYEKREYSLYEINRMRNENFANNPEVFAEILNMKKYYGCDSDMGAELVNYILACFDEEIENHVNLLNGRIKYGLSAPNYIMSGKKAMADFNGRHKGDPYNTHISCMDATYPEVVSFAGKLKYSGNGINGNVVDFFISPNLLKGQESQFADFIECAIKCGFYQMQMNVMDSKTLIDAKKHPEMYPGLMVRVWGFSAYFNDLSDDYKDLLIARAKKSENINY